MSPQRTESAPRNGARTTALVALVAALLGGSGGAALMPYANNAGLVSKDDMNAAVMRIEAKLERIEIAITELHAEAAVARYEREHRVAP